MRTDRENKLYGPSIQYADGSVVPGRPLDVEHILAAFARANDKVRGVFLSVFAHNLTVAVRALLIDRPVPAADLDKVWKINEFMHQLTNCLNPEGQWSADDEADFIRAAIETSFSYQLDRYIGGALAAAAGSTIQTRQSAAAK